MLEFDDIQHILLTRTPAITGRYEFLSFDTPEGGRAWLTELLDKVQSAADAQTTMDSSDRWVTLAFTWNGLRALGVPEESLATFPDEFREGMAARADILGDTGTCAPEHWVGGLAGDDRARDRDLVLPHGRAVPALHRGARQAAGENRRRPKSVLPRPQRVTTVQLRPRPLRLPRSIVTAGDEGFRRGTDTRLRRGAGTRRVHPRLSRRRRPGGQSA